MTGVGIINIDQIEELVGRNENIRNGCLLDTNILISASLPIDPNNEAAEKLLVKLHQLKIPVYSNVNIRAEFLEIHRRVLIPEVLIEFLEDAGDELGELLVHKITAVKTSYRKSLENKKIYKFTDDRIKEFRGLLSSRSVDGKDGWQIFCENYLYEQLSTVWDDVVKMCRLNFIKIREGEAHPLLISKVSWDGVTELMGRFGIGSADSMILNLFLSSKISMVATADGDIKFVEKFLRTKNKYVLEV